MFISLLKDKQKMKNYNFLLYSFFLLFLNLISKERLSSEPFVSGDTFRSFSKFIIDETNIPFNPDDVQKGDIIFVSTDFPEGNLKKFFKTYHPQIKNQYILITHNGDSSVPGNYIEYLNDSKIYAWFGQNTDVIYYPKFIPIPIGLENRHIGRGHYEIILDLLKKDIDSYPKTHLLYSNFSPHTNPNLRLPIYNFFKNKPFCYFQEPKKTIRGYLTDICYSKFVLSPHGHGLDCHRTWEALYLGAIPIVVASTLDKLYEDLPVIVINNWNEVTDAFLIKKYEEMKSKKYKMEKLTFKYWKDLIINYQKSCINFN